MSMAMVIWGLIVDVNATAAVVNLGSWMRVFSITELRFSICI